MDSRKMFKLVLYTVSLLSLIAITFTHGLTSLFSITRGEQKNTKGSESLSLFSLPHAQADAPVGGGGGSCDGCGCGCSSGSSSDGGANC